MEMITVYHSNFLKHKVYNVDGFSGLFLYFLKYIFCFHYVNVSVFIKFSLKTSVFYPNYH